MNKMIRKIGPTEHQIQCAIVEWANNTNFGSEKIGDYLIAIPNGGNRSITEAVRLKKEGVKSGVSDIFLAISVMKDYRVYGGLWIEVKTKKGKLSPAQKNWMEKMNRNDYKADVVRSLDEGIQAIKNYLDELIF